MSNRSIALLCLVIAAINGARVKHTYANLASKEKKVGPSDMLGGSAGNPFGSMFGAIGNMHGGHGNPSNNGANPFGDMGSMFNSHGNPFGAIGNMHGGHGNPSNSGANAFGDMGDVFGGKERKGDKGPIAEMSELDAGASEPETYPETPSCFTANMKMRMPMFPMVLPGTIHYNSPEGKMRIDQGHGAYILERYDLQCKVTVSDETKVEKIPEEQKMSSFALPPRYLTTWEGTQEIAGVKCYRYKFGLSAGDMMKNEFTLWVSAQTPHFPVYMQAVVGGGGMEMITHQYLFDHSSSDCSFEDSIWAAPQCHKMIQEEADQIAREEAELLAREEAKREAERRAAEQKAKEEADRLSREEAERLAAEREAQEEIKRLAEEKAAKEKALAEMSARLKAAKAKQGDLTISLLWDQGSSPVDLDLHVICPGGHISYRAKSQCGGTLDVDMQSKATKPVENVFFGSPPNGKYQVYVHNYSKRPIKDFTVIVSIKGEKEILNGKVGLKDQPGVLVKEFSLS